MPFLRCLKRIKQRRGHGVHSPFAYGLITNVICSPHLYYAFADIEKEISEKGLNSGFVSGINHLSFGWLTILMLKISWKLIRARE